MKALIPALALVLLASAAQADVAGLVGHTVVGATPDGLTRRIQLRADRTYRISVSDGSTSTGTWSTKGDKLCYFRIQPEPAPGDLNPLCVEGLDGHKLGDAWTTTGHHGLPMKMTVVRGP
ncbi:MAG TPA: hypothetical protein VIJ94_13330 [Caulobacteraceae bacterium]